MSRPILYVLITTNGFFQVILITTTQDQSRRYLKSSAGSSHVSCGIFVCPLRDLGVSFSEIFVYLRFPWLSELSRAAKLSWFLR